MSAPVNAPAPFRAAVERNDIDAVSELLAPDIVFHSPVTFHPFVGRETVTRLLEIVAGTFEDFRYTDELETDGAHALIFRAERRRQGARGHRPAAPRRAGPDRATSP